ncbi:hypothetical protein, partial [Roseateles sp. P5_E11]
RALAGIKPGVDTLALVRKWVLSLWDGPAADVRQRLEGTFAAVPAEEVIRLVRGSASEEIPREAWRRARNALHAAMGEDEDLDAAIEFVVSMAWDLSKSPRSTTDIWNAWEASVLQPANRKAGWPQQVQDEVINAVRDAHTVVYTRLGAPPTDPEEAQEFHTEAQKQVDAELQRQGYLQRYVEFKAYAGSVMVPAMNAWRSNAEQSIYDACGAASMPA